ncbi:MAG: hypothetical protein OXN17_15780 [Candidatus Poribacteria bacterium]|nr:hypothetical protein [Candidatus Poribacteria bacterium]MDE0505502.1 hypothetical protein [Candidatus Poribacteria bacterium]
MVKWMDDRTSSVDTEFVHKTQFLCYTWGAERLYPIATSVWGTPVAFRYFVANVSLGLGDDAQSAELLTTL